MNNKDKLIMALTSVGIVSHPYYVIGKTSTYPIVTKPLNDKCLTTIDEYVKHDSYSYNDYYNLGIKVATYECVDPRINDPSSSWYKPPYFKVFGFDKNIPKTLKVKHKYHHKKNKRPKSTKIHTKIPIINELKYF